MTAGKLSYSGTWSVLLKKVNEAWSLGHSDHSFIVILKSAQMQPQQHCPEGSHRALESVPDSGTSQAQVSATLLTKVGHHWICKPSDTGKLGSCHSHTTNPPPEGWLDKHEQQDSSLHKSRAFLDFFLMHMLMSWMGGEREDRKSGREHFFILQRKNKMGAHWMLQDRTVLVSPTPPGWEHPYVQLCWAPRACQVIHITLQTMGRMKPHRIFFSESTTKARGDGRRGCLRQGYCGLVQSDKVARWSKECKQHCPCTWMSGCSFPLIQ